MTFSFSKYGSILLCAVAIGAPALSQAQVVIRTWHHPHVFYMARHHHRHHLWYNGAWVWRDSVWMSHHHGWRYHR
jgi:hypothetical protein